MDWGTILIGLAGTVAGAALAKLAENYLDKQKEPRLFIADSNTIIEWDWDAGKMICLHFGLKESVPHYQHGVMYCGTYEDVCNSKYGRKKLLHPAKALPAQ